MEPETTPAHQAPRNSSQSVLIPIAIILGFGMVAAAIYFSGNSGGNELVFNEREAVERAEVTPEPTGTINPVTEEDHIRGNPNAPILLVEYSDFDCPFCKRFHETMNQVLDEYGPSGQVAWVYRHLPLEQLHPAAPRIAEASECIADLGGNDAFWTFSDLIFEERGTNEPTNLARLGEFAEASGVASADLDACLESERMRAEVEEDFNNAVSLGARGTPYTVVVVGDDTGLINGAQPYSAVKQIIDNLLAQIDGA